MSLKLPDRWFLPFWRAPLTHPLPVPKLYNFRTILFIFTIPSSETFGPFLGFLKIPSSRYGKILFPVHWTAPKWSGHTRYLYLNTWCSCLYYTESSSSQSLTRWTGYLNFLFTPVKHNTFFRSNIFWDSPSWVRFIRRDSPSGVHFIWRNSPSGVCFVRRDSPSV